MSDDKKELQEWLKMNSDKIQKNVKIITPEDIDQDFLLHISKRDKIKEFIPFISHRAYDSENRNILRVYTAPTITGCLVGYASATYDFLNDPLHGEVEYRGGWKIYALPFKAALRPTGRLIFDVKHSDEHWLVTYNKNTVKYPGKIIGEVFIESIKFIGRSGKAPEEEITYFINISGDKKIKFSKNNILKKGYYKIEGQGLRHTSEAYSDKHFVVTEITEDVYRETKKACADLLSFKEPLYNKW